MKLSLREALRKSRFRARFRLDDEDRAYIQRLGLSYIRAHAHDFIKKRLAPAQPKNDGKQTPFKGHPVFKAQHATATCCRGCLEKWHRIELGRPLSSEETEKVAAIIMDWIETQLKEGGGR